MGLVRQLSSPGFTSGLVDSLCVSGSGSQSAALPSRSSSLDETSSSVISSGDSFTHDFSGLSGFSFDIASLGGSNFHRRAPISWGIYSQHTAAASVCEGA